MLCIFFYMDYTLIIVYFNNKLNANLRLKKEFYYRKDNSMKI